MKGRAVRRNISLPPEVDEHVSREAARLGMTRSQYLAHAHQALTRRDLGAILTPELRDAMVRRAHRLGEGMAASLEELLRRALLGAA